MLTAVSALKGPSETSSAVTSAFRGDLKRTAAREENGHHPVDSPGRPGDSGAGTPGSAESAGEWRGPLPCAGVSVSSALKTNERPANRGHRAFRASPRPRTSSAPGRAVTTRGDREQERLARPPPAAGAGPAFPHGPRRPGSPSTTHAAPVTCREPRKPRKPRGLRSPSEAGPLRT